jgi:hypothetical protein
MQLKTCRGIAIGMLEKLSLLFKFSCQFSIIEHVSMFLMRCCLINYGSFFLFLIKWGKPTCFIETESVTIPQWYQTIGTVRPMLF